MGEKLIASWLNGDTFEYLFYLMIKSSPNPTLPQKYTPDDIRRLFHFND
jgi:hypothetical protein